MPKRDPMHDDKALRAAGFDGLYESAAGGCACEVGDLGPCMDGPFDSCQPGYKRAGCNAECGLGCDWHMVEEKPNAD